LHKSLKQTFDDADISFSQVVHWVQFFINKFQQAKLSVNDSGLYLSVYTGLPVLTFSTSDVNEVTGRKYFELPNSIHDFNLDGGIKYVSYVDKDGACAPSFASVRFTRTDPVRAKRLYMTEYEKPTPGNPYFYRVRDYVYLLGVEDISVRYVEAGLLTTFDPFSECDMDQPMWLDEGVMADVFKSVVDLGRFVMLVPAESVNEGSNTVDKGDIPTQKIVSVNQQPEQ